MYWSCKLTLEVEFIEVELHVGLLDFAIGQADTYTTMQLAQYVSTIATNGKRFAPTLLKEVYLPSNDDMNGKQLIKHRTIFIKSI